LGFGAEECLDEGGQVSGFDDQVEVAAVGGVVGQLAPIIHADRSLAWAGRWSRSGSWF
jgi:hypothetical protein